MSDATKCNQWVDGTCGYAIELAAARKLLSDSLMMFELTYGREAASFSLMAKMRAFLMHTTSSPPPQEAER